MDLRFRRLARPGADVELQQRTFDLLQTLLAEPHVLHERAELLSRVWSGVIVEDANLSQAIWTLRNALGAGRRDWIRTVAKRGYVFEPPGPVVASAPSSQAVTAGTAPPSRKSLRDVSPSAHPRGGLNSPAVRWSSALLILGTLLVSLLLGSPGTGRSGPRIIAVMDIADSGSADDSRWPALLLRAWLEWKLSVLPEVTVMQRDHLAADRGSDSETQVVLVSSGALPDRPGHYFLQAEVEIDGRMQRERIEGSDASLPARIDALSANLMRALLPAREDAIWPPLIVEADQARGFAAFTRAREARQWSEAARLGRELVIEAPDFGLLRLQLAEVLSTLGHVNDARAQAEAAIRLLAGLEPDSAELLQAQRHAVSEDVVATLSAYAELSRRYPGQPRFVLEHARALIASGRSADAHETMAQVAWSRQPVWTRIAAELILAHAQLHLGDPVQARTHAAIAHRLAVGAGWELEIGHAVFALAAADLVEMRGIVDGGLFREAAAHFERAGDPMRALSARLHGVGEVTGPEGERQLDTLLDQARAAGHRSLEIQTLRVVAFRHYRAGNLAAYRTRLARAATVAESVGHERALRRLDLDLVGLDIDSNDFAMAERRIQRLRAAGEQGETAFWIEHFGMVLAWRRGDFARMAKALDAAHTAAGTQSPTVLALNHCNRAQLHLIRGDPGAARAGFERCRASAAPVYQLHAEAGLARVDLYGGDHEAALLRIDQIEQRLSEVPSAIDQIGIQLEMGELALRAGAIERAEPLMIALLARSQKAGLHAIESHLRLGLARIAAQQQNWSEAETQLEAARALGHAEDWLLTVPLTLLSAWDHHRRGEHESASALLVNLAHDAARRGDAVAEIEAYTALEALGLQGGEEFTQRAALIARSGLRGLRAGWARNVAAVERGAATL